MRAREPTSFWRENVAVAVILFNNYIPRVRVGYEMVDIISYATSASGIIVLLRPLTKYREFFPSLFVKTTDFSLFLNLRRSVQFHIWRAWYNGSYTMMAKPIRALELQYSIIQFLIISVSRANFSGEKVK